MKKSVLVLLLVVLTICGCTKDEEKNQSNDFTNKESDSFSEIKVDEDEIMIPFTDSSEEHFMFTVGMNAKKSINCY